MQGVIALFSFVSLALVPALAAQVPFNSWHEGSTTVLADEELARWDLDKLPNPNDTNHLVFETVYSLLQHWPNTRMRNGHNIVPGVVPKGTLLYHGTNARKLPPSLEWVAIDPEHSYVFCHSGFEINQADQAEVEDCWQLTLATTRPLRVVYFDGTSAGKTTYGTLDTEDLLAWGVTSPDNMFEEWVRAENLCKWGKKFDVDGFVRMEMSFEIILCDFSSGVSEVSWVNLASWRYLPPVFPAFVPFEVINSGSWHNRLPGETRIQLDLAGMVSFYDPQLVPSLVAARAGQERWDHRVGNISSEELAAVKSRLGTALVRPGDLSSGINWETLFQVIIDRFAGRLELTHHLLNLSTTDPQEAIDLANKTQTQLKIMLTPYLLLSATPPSLSDATDLDWTIPIYKLCATTHTKFLETQLASMTDSEKLLLQAAKGTTREICRVVTKMWAAGVYAGIDQALNTKDSLDPAEIARIRDQWLVELNGLMAWLDWSVWIKCKPECKTDEMCYLPTWPIGFPGFPPLSPRAGASENDWIRPEPRCIRRVEPYDIDVAYDGNTKDRIP